MSTEIPQFDRFQPRDYQLSLCNAFENEKFKKFLVVWPRRCLSGNTHIVMANGSWKYLKDIVIGDEIRSWDGSKFVIDMVKNHWKTEIKKTKIVKSFSSLPLVSSDDHVFANTSNGDRKVKWSSLKDLTSRRRLLQYAGLHRLGNESSDNLAEFLGYMLGDGYCSAEQQPKFTNINPEILDRVKELVSVLFPDIKINKPANGNCTDLRFSNGTNGGGAFRNSIKQFFKDNNINVQKSIRRLPQLIWSLNDQSILRFFAGLISSDGSIYTHKQGFVSSDRHRSIPPSVEVTLSCGQSDLYAWDIYWLLRRVGIFPQVPYKEKGSNWKIKIAKSKDIKTILTLPIFGKQEAQKKALDMIKDRLKQPLVIDSCIYTAFKVQDGQDEELYDIETENHHNFIANGYLVHNSGKDICALNLLVRAAFRRVGTYFYIFPTFQMGRRILWDAIDISGKRILTHYIPEELIESRNEQQMRIRLVNGSQIQILGSDNFDNTLVGTNAVGMVFSEYALSDSRAYSYSIPILKASNGWVMMVSTPRGKNNLWDLYNIAKKSKDWFCEKLSVDETKHISIEEIEKEISEGQISRDLALQEFFCSFSLGVEGSFYSKCIDSLRLKNQITSVMWDPYLPVHTAWDLGYNDKTCIVFAQCSRDGQVRIIDYYENNKKGLDHYAKIVKEKEYSYGKHIAPFDIAVHDLGTGISRWKMMFDLGITFMKYNEKPVSIMDGIEAVRRNLPKMWFDERSCSSLLRSLENYRQEYDHKRKVYNLNPLHDEFSHACFAGDTKIMMADGLKDIKDILIGDFVKTPFGLRKVLGIHKKLTNSITKINVGNTTIESTSDHEIFTQRGLVYSDTLRYTDTMENYSIVKEYVWKIIKSLKKFDIGFKKTFLSLKMNPGLSLMQSFIDGEDIITEEMSHGQQHLSCIEMFGRFIMEKLKKAFTFITSTIIVKTILLPIYNYLVQAIIYLFIPTIQTVGLIPVSVKNYWKLLGQSQQFGIEVKKEERGIEIMRKTHCQRLEENFIKKTVISVGKILWERNMIKDFVLMPVRRSLGFVLSWIMLIVLVAFVRLYSIVINTLLKRHVVKNVQTIQLEEPKLVYDLTIDQDNCYYANGYLVSNSDAMRYLACALPKLMSNSDPKALEDRYNQATGRGQADLPRFFQDDHRLY